MSVVTVVTVTVVTCHWSCISTYCWEM